jgi:Tfp pilus assembly protein PilO
MHPGPVLAATTPAAPSGDLLGSATNLFVIVSVIVAILALGWAFRTRRNVVEIQNYKGLAESYEKLHAADKAEIESAQVQIGELQQCRAEDQREIQALRAKVETLTEILTGKTVVDDLARAVDRLDAVTSKIEDLTRRGAS